MVRSSSETAVVLLAGGAERRFAGKLEYPIEGRAMVVRVFERARAAGWPIYVAGRGSFSRSVDALLCAPLLIDRRPGSGPLQALLGTCAQIRAERVFALAADQPRLDADVLRRLDAAWQPDDEAVVPEHEGTIEPLAALYARRAILREAFDLRRAGKRAMRDLVARIAARFVAFGAASFQNVNRRADLA
jgi:molybdopterin-guanine dinucleotide biosynthesis protein A